MSFHGRKSVTLQISSLKMILWSSIYFLVEKAPYHCEPKYSPSKPYFWQWQYYPPDQGSFINPEPSAVGEYVCEQRRGTVCEQRHVLCVSRDMYCVWAETCTVCEQWRGMYLLWQNGEEFCEESTLCKYDRRNDALTIRNGSHTGVSLWFEPYDKITVHVVPNKCLQDVLVILKQMLKS